MPDLWADFDDPTTKRKDPAGNDVWADFDAQQARDPTTDTTSKPAPISAAPVAAQPVKPANGPVYRTVDAISKFIAAPGQGLLESDVLGALRRSNASIVNSIVYSANDIIEQAVQKPLRNIMQPLGIMHDPDPLGAAARVKSELAVQREINDDRNIAMKASGPRPTFAEFIANPADALRRETRRVVEMGAESLLPMGVAVATRNPALGAGILGGTTGTQEYTEMRGQGYGPTPSAISSVGQGVMESVGESVGLPFVFDRLSKGSLRRAMATQFGQEYVTQLGQQNIEDAATGNVTPVGEQLGGAFEAGLVGAGMGGSAHVAVNLPGAIKGLVQKPKPAPLGAAVNPPLAPAAVPTPAVAPVPAVTAAPAAVFNGDTNPTQPAAQGMQPVADRAGFAQQAAALMRQSAMEQAARSINRQPAQPGIPVVPENAELGALLDKLPPEVIQAVRSALGDQPALSAAATARPQGTPAAQPSPVPATPVAKPSLADEAAAMKSARLDRAEVEGRQARADEETDLERSLTAVSGSIYSADDIARAVAWAQANGRPDIVQAGHARVAQEIAHAKENHEKFNNAVTEKGVTRAEEAAEQFRKRLAEYGGNATPEPAPAETPPTPSPAEPAGQSSFAQQVAANMRMRAQEQAARATPTTAPAVQPPVPVPAPPGRAAPSAADDGFAAWQAAEREAAPAAPPAPKPVADPAMQNRDRSRTASVAQMQDIRKAPDPERLGFSRDPNTGAPMVGEGRAIPEADKGRADAVVMASGRRVPVRYAVVEASDLAASHNADGKVNPGYEAAPLKALNNGRTAGLQAAYASGHAGTYRQGIAADAELHGVSAEAIASKREPVLVRLYDPAENTGDMGAESNASAQLGLSPVEQAQTDARSLPDLSGVQWAEDGSLAPGANANFFRAWFRNMGEAQAATLQDAQGRPNAAAIQRVRAAMVQRAYGDERLLTAMAEEVNPDNRNVLNALVQAAPAFATLDRGGLVDNLREALVGGLDVVRDASARGLSLRDALAQGDMLGRNPDADAVAQFMADNARSAKRMAEAFKAMAEYAADAEAQTQTLDVFGTAPTPTVGAALDRAGIDHDTRADAGHVAEGRGGREPAQGEGAAAGDAFALQPDSAAAAERAQEVAPNAGLFGAPSTRDFLDDAQRRRDAQRNGQTGTGRTDMLAGNGELFAGDRPAQARVMQEAETVDAPTAQPAPEASLPAARSVENTANEGDTGRRIQPNDIAAEPVSTLTNGQNNVALDDAKRGGVRDTQARDPKSEARTAETPKPAPTSETTNAETPPAETQELTRENLTPEEQTAYDRAQNSTEARQKAGNLSRAQGEADAYERGFPQAIRRVLGALAARIEYVRDYAGLPDDLRDGVESRNAERAGKVVTAAIYDPVTKRVFIVTSVVKTPVRAVWNALHEIAGHEGLRKLLGAKLDPALNIALQNPTVKALAEAIAKDRSMASGQRLLAAEEALAELSAAVRTGDYEHIQNRYGVEIGDGIRAEQSVKASIDNFLKRLQVMLNDLFGRPVFLDEDVRALLDAAFQASKGDGNVRGSAALESADGDKTQTAAPAAPSFTGATGRSVITDGRLLSFIDAAKAAGADMSALRAAVANTDSLERAKAIASAIDAILPSLQPTMRVTGTKNAVTDAERAAAGRDPILRDAIKTNEETLVTAMRTLRDDPSAGKIAVERLARGGVEGISLADEAILLVHKTTLLNARDAAGKKLADADASDAAKEVARGEWAEAEAQIAMLDQAAVNSGREWGRLGQFRQRMLREDFTFAAMERKERARLERPLTLDESVKIKAMADTIAALQSKVDAMQARMANAESEAAYENLTKRIAHPRRARTLDSLRRAADDARARLRGTQGVPSRRGQSGAVISPTVFLDLATIGAYHVANGANSLADWVSAMRADIGAKFDTFKADHPNIFKAAKREADKPWSDGPTVAGVLEAIAPDDLTNRDVYRLAEAHVQAGVRGEAAVMAAVHASLSEQFEGITERDVRRMFSDYGNASFPSQDEAKTELRKLRSLVQMQESIDRITEGLAPLRSGPQRDAMTQDVREKRTQLNELLKTLAKDAKSPTQMRSYNDMRVRNLTNQIEDLEKQIQTGERPAAKTRPQPSAEIQALMDRRDALTRERDAVDGGAKRNEAEKAALRKKIAAIDAKMRGEGPAPKDPVQRVDDKEMTELQAKIDALRARRDAMTREDSAREAVGNRIAILMQRLAGMAKPAAKASTPDSAVVADLKRIRDELATDLRELEREQVDTEAKYQDMRGKQIEKRIAELKQRIADGDFAKRPRIPRLLNEANQRANFELDNAKKDFLRYQMEDELNRRTGFMKALGFVGDSLNLGRAMMTSYDFSGLLRQGGFIAFNPARTARAVGPALKAFLSEVSEHKNNAEIAARPNARRYKRDGLQLTGIGAGPLTQVEEAYASRWLNKLPDGWKGAGIGAVIGAANSGPVGAAVGAVLGIKGGSIVRGSGRAYSVLLNRMRADTYDVMAATLTRTGIPTEKEGKAIAKIINVGTGRGRVPGGEGLGQLMNNVFFAPRLVASRFQLLSGYNLLYGPETTPRTRKLVARMYARYLIGTSVLMGLAAFALGGDDGEDKRPMISFDPRSSDFLKIRIGNTYIDAWAGLSQVTTFSARELTGETVNSKGEVTALRPNYTLTDLRRALGQDIPENKLNKDGGLPYGGRDAAGVLGSFLRTKLGPAPSTVINIATGSNVVGQEMTPLQNATQMVTPMSFQNIGDIMEEQGIPKGTAIFTLGILGMGVQNRAQTNAQQFADFNAGITAVQTDVKDRLAALPVDQWQKALDAMKQKYGPAMTGVELSYYKRDGKYGKAGEPRRDADGKPILKSNRISDSATYRKNAQADDGEQTHHLIPDNLARNHPLMAQARSLGYDLDRASNLVNLPAKAASGQIAHNTSHPGYDAEVYGALQAAEKQLEKDYGSLKAAPAPVVLDAVRKVEADMRARVQKRAVPTKDGRLAALDDESEEAA